MLRGGSASYGRRRTTPYLPVIEALKTYLGIHGREDQREIRQRVAGKLLTLDRTLAPLVTPLLALLGVPVDDAAWSALDPPQRRQRIQDAVKRLVVRESQVQPLMLIVGDLHWIDSESQALLDGLVESLPTARILLVVTYRPEYRHAWGSKTHYIQLRLDPLVPGSAHGLLTTLLGQDESLETLTRVLIERTGGNPFFLEETVQTLVETRVLVGERGAYRVTKEDDVGPVPATVQAILAARIDRLSADQKALLQAASVIGKDVPVTLLKSIADMPEESLRDGLTHLQTASTTAVARFTPESSRRSRRSTPIGWWSTSSAWLTTPSGGEVWEKAATYLRSAGARALAQSAYPEAVTFFEQALTALHHVPDTRQKTERAIDLRLDLRQALFPLNELATVWRYLEEAEGLARTLGDSRRLGWVSAYMSGHHLHSGGHVREVRHFADTVEAIAERLDDVALRIAARYYVAHASHLAGDSRQAEDVCRGLMRSLRDQPSRERFGLAVFPAVMSRGHLARVLAERGVFDEGDAHGQEAIRIAEALEHPFSVVVACLDLAYLKSVRGQLSQAAHLLERAVAHSREWSFTNQMPVAMASLGYVYAWSGRIDEGVASLQHAVTAHKRAGIGAFFSLDLTRLGEVSLLANRVENARACADRALGLARGRGERVYETRVLRLLGDIASRGTRPDVATASAHYGAALALASELEMRPLVAHCHAGLRRLYRRTDDPAQARQHLSTATAMYAEMGMTYWSERLEDR